MWSVCPRPLKHSEPPYRQNANGRWRCFVLVLSGNWRHGSRPGSKRGHRRALPPELPRVEVVIDVPQDQRQCGCGTPTVRIGEDISEQWDIIPMQIRVRRMVRPRYACPKGDQAPVQVAAPAQVLPRSNFSAGFLAMMAVVKYVDGLPLARFEKVLARHEVEVPRQSMARAMIKLAQALQPLHNLARDTLLDAPVIHMDETTVQVLKEPGRSPTTKSYMWVQRGGPPGRTVVLFDYESSRSGQPPWQKCPRRPRPGLVRPVVPHRGRAESGERSGALRRTPDGAHASAVLYSLLETAKANEREPYAWLRFVLERLPLATTIEEIEALLPWNTHDQDLAMNLAASE